MGTQRVLNLVTRIKKKNISVFFISKKNGLLLTVTKKQSPGWYQMFQHLYFL